MQRNLLFCNCKTDKLFGKKRKCSYLSSLFTGRTMSLKFCRLKNIVIGLILTVCPLNFTFAAKTLIIRGSDNYPPFEYINNKGNPEGFNVELFHALMQELKLKYELKLENWDSVRNGIENKTIDAAIGMIYSKERAQSVRFTLPTCIMTRNFITRKKDQIRSVEDLKGKEIIVEKGGWFHQYLLDNQLAGKIIESSDIYQSLKLLEEGKHDAVLAGDLVAQFAIKQMQLKDLYIGDLGIAPQNYGMAVNQDNDELLYQLNIGLQRLKLSGTYDQIYNKWFGIYESQKNKKVLIIAISIFLFVASLLVLFVWLLKKKVANATRMLEHSKQELKEHSLKSEFIIRTNGIILIQFDLARQVFTRINDQDKQKEHYSVEQYLEMIHPDDISIAKQFIDNLNKAEETKIETEFRIIYEGTYEWFIITAVAYTYNEQGKITSYMGLRRNNSKWNSILNDLIVLREKAEASNRLKSAFLANMSHEIRTPLNAIVGFSELITQTEEEEEKEQFIDIVKKNNELLLQLINDVLDLSRIEAGYTNFNYSNFDFSTHFNELYLSLKLKETKDVGLVCMNPYKELNICSDSNRISQVITNFITNAFKFTQKGSITLSYQYENEGIKVCVTDTGIGIARENQARIFERFEKLNDFAQGTGLGLPICKVIIEALQGNIGVESEPGTGSTFWFWIPCNLPVEKRPGNLPDKNQIDNLLSKTSVAPDLLRTKKTILVAEDIENNYIIISTIIKDNYHIIRAENGVEAVEKAKLHHPDIILMDMKMPLMDGLEATRQIREFNADIPIIALTAYVFDTNKKDAIDAGCNDFLSKPVNRTVLIDALNNL